MERQTCICQENTISLAAAASRKKSHCNLEQRARSHSNGRHLTKHTAAFTEIRNWRGEAETERPQKDGDKTGWRARDGAERGEIEIKVWKAGD